MKYKELKNKFLKHFHVNHLSLDLLNVLENVSQYHAQSFILNKLYNEMTSDELKNVLGNDYLKLYFNKGTQNNGTTRTTKKIGFFKSKKLHF